jgi:hypothetical protein
MGGVEDIIMAYLDYYVVILLRIVESIEHVGFCAV